MKVDKTINSFLLYLAVFSMLITGYYVNRIALSNNVAGEYVTQISLTGSRLSDKVYATVSKNSERKIADVYSTEYACVLYNISDSAMKNWKMLLTVPEGTIVESTQNAESIFYTDNSTLIISPEDYNVEIGSYEAIDFFVSLSTREEFNPGQIKFVGYQDYTKKHDYLGGVIIAAIFIWSIAFVGFLVTKYNLRSYYDKQQNSARIILQSMNTFISFIDAKDPYTRGHSKRVAMYAAEMGKRMGLSEDEVQNIYYAGLLHDAGKISIPDAVLNKPGKLTDEERRCIQDHTISGGNMLKQLSSIRGIRETALYHHERFDGNGYPEGLKGEAIPLYARIVGVADSYDAMSSNRVYRRHLNKDEIIEEIQKGSGTQFDPDIVKYMVDMINDGYVNVVKMETSDSDEDSKDFHLSESDIPGVYMGY
ncbi:HD-GYP domain-containing protein [Butyrivibrio sp. YAB3001]|uniref:HD-GYP domain-containing protein n=1 Tax=Butyrivibrio sp. YAB3001 TaxID=1520812 RepID=UPI0008F657E8|nr:HD-GYP domain-containing protein [Butyrivibrio sp. YAB3001]SFC44250.1 HD domain-containing protein [Butyrivibrio sp. YAB3001]